MTDWYGLEELAREVDGGHLRPLSAVRMAFKKGLSVGETREKKKYDELHMTGERWSWPKGIWY